MPRQYMSKVRAVMALLLILLGLLSYSNPEYIDNALERSHNHNSNYNLVELQDNEELSLIHI